MCSKITKELRVSNKLGLHARPATIIVKILHEFKSEVTFSYNEKEINAKSILNILTLAVPFDALIAITANGVDAHEVIDRLTKVFEDCFE